MASNADSFLKKTLGDDFFESLQKFELWKPGTRTTVDHEEIKTALQIVPRTVMTILIRELSPMEINENKEIDLFFGTNAKMKITKHERDVYSGEIEQDNKKLVDFKYRSLPGIGLVIMSAFELYDMENLLNTPLQNETLAENAEDKIQKLIDERLAFHDLISKVVDRKIEERDAIQQLMLKKITENLRDEKKAEQTIVSTPVKEQEHVVENPKKKVSPLKGFLDNKKNKSKPKPIEFSVELVKSETVRCPDCNNALITGHVFTGCICLGDDRDRKVYIKKSEEGAKISFGRGWDPENIEMLVEILRRKRGQ